MTKAIFYTGTTGKGYYGLLWGIALAITLAMFLLEKFAFTASERQIMKPGFHMTSVTSESINELLLSAKDLNINEKQSFINLYLKNDNNLTTSYPQTQAENIYNRIFEKKVASIKTKPNSNDFSIKPIPK